MGNSWSCRRICEELEVFIYYSGNKDLSCEGGNLAYIQMVDDTLGNRVDINCTD